jgi:hypothetical protein
VERQEALLGDAPVGPAAGQQPEDLALATRQRPYPQLDVRVVAGPWRLGRKHHGALAVDHRADGVGDLPAGPVLGQQAISTADGHGRDGLPAGVAGQQQHLGRRRGDPDRGECRAQVSVGQVRVQQQHGRPVVGGQLNRPPAAVGHADHGEVVLGIQDHGEPFGEELLVVGHHKGDGSFQLDTPSALVGTGKRSGRDRSAPWPSPAAPLVNHQAQRRPGCVESLLGSEGPFEGPSQQTCLSTGPGKGVDKPVDRFKPHLGRSFRETPDGDILP